MAGVSFMMASPEHPKHPSLSLLSAPQLSLSLSLSLSCVKETTILLPPPSCLRNPWGACKRLCYSGCQPAMDSSSLGLPGASSGASNDSLHGLKFGKKIYFEDRNSGGSSSKSSPPPAPPDKVAPAPPPPPGKKGKGVGSVGGQQQQPPRCQVEGCKVDLTGAKAYYCRHKVCGMHSKAPKVTVGGLEQRFCQQCSRFHQLPEFDQGKRSCRRRLAGHNERRRKPPPGPFASRYGCIGTSLHEGPSKFRSFLMDFSYPKLTNNARDVWPTVGGVDRVPSNQWQEILEPSSSAATSTHPYLQGPPAMALYPASEVPPGDSIAGVSDSSCALSLLSTQPWSNSSTRNQAPTIPASSSFDVTPMAQQAIASNYMINSWGFRGHGSRGNSHEIQHEMGLVGVSEAANAHFTGELELALQGNDHCLDHDSDRSYDHSGAGMHWSL